MIVFLHTFIGLRVGVKPTLQPTTLSLLNPDLYIYKNKLRQRQGRPKAITNPSPDLIISNRLIKCDKNDFLMNVKT